MSETAVVVGNPEGEKIELEKPEAEREIKEGTKGEAESQQKATGKSNTQMLQEINEKLDALLAANQISLQEDLKVNVPIEVRIECARGEILNAVEKITREQGLPAAVIDGVISSVLEEIRGQEKMELVNAFNKLRAEKDEEINALSEELQKAKKAAKKVLKQDAPETTKADQEGDAGDGDRNETDH